MAQNNLSVHLQLKKSRGNTIQKLTKIKRSKQKLKALQQKKNIKRKCKQLTYRQPFPDYVQAMAKELHPECQVQWTEVNEASEAYPRGLTPPGGTLCKNCATNESFNFLMFLSWLGLKKLINVMVTDEELKKKVQENRSTHDQGHHQHQEGDEHEHEERDDAHHHQHHEHTHE